MNVNGSAMMEADFSRDEAKMETNSLKEAPQGDQEKENRNSLMGSPVNEATEGSKYENDSANEKKKKRRRRPKGGSKHKRYKPYDKMSWTERRDLEEKEAVRANQKREDAFKHGHPVAPYNTTQYLMEDHIKNEEISPDLHLEGHYHRNNSRESREGSGGGSESSEEFYSTSEDEEIENDSSYQEHQFTETYDNMAAERLRNMSKEELIKDYVELETKLDRLEKRLRRRQKRSKTSDDSSGSLSSGGEEFMDLDAVKRFQAENQKLKDENNQLKKEIAKLTDREES